LEKRKPSFDLERFKAVCGDPRTLRLSVTANQSALALGFDYGGVAALVRTMRSSMFYKSMTSYENHRKWQDVYHVPSEAGLLYLKFTDDTVSEFFVLSFKEKET
jgi:motility quorum-sensing regulator/GCU-specific mRNA interferase toxin